METQAPHPLDYAGTRTRSGGRRYFTSVLGVFAVCGIVANAGFVYGTVEALHRAHWAYRDLRRDPRAHIMSREIDPVTIDSLRQPWGLWCAAGALALASTFGLLLAVHLLRSIWQLDRSQESGWRRIARYRKYKPIGVAATAVAFLWFGMANHVFWVKATRHVSVGSGPPLLETIILVICGMLPCWWIERPSGRAEAAADVVPPR